MRHLAASGPGTEVYRHPVIPPLHVAGEIRAGVLALMGTAENDLTELTNGESLSSPVKDDLREMAITVERIAKAVAKDDAGTLTRRPMT